MIARLFVALLFARSAFLPAGASPLLPNVARSLLPFPHRASLVRSRSATAATPFSSLLPPQAALGNVPSCATPRKEKNIEILRFFRKGSNMWSKSYAEVNRKHYSRKTGNCQDSWRESFPFFRFVLMQKRQIRSICFFACVGDVPRCFLQSR